MSKLGYLTCGGMTALVLAALLVAANDQAPPAAALSVLLLLGGVLPLASVAWASAFRRR
ncbi:MAG: hypothetical protein JW900_08165 [Anaerolineae bacterium]|nr:hypothetical protein [Anaerolineae bacterium]